MVSEMRERPILKIRQEPSEALQSWEFLRSSEIGAPVLELYADKQINGWLAVCTKRSVMLNNSSMFKMPEEQIAMFPIQRR